MGSIPELGRSPGEGKGYPLQYSGLENSMDCIVHGVAKSQTWLGKFHFNFSLNAYNITFPIFNLCELKYWVKRHQDKLVVSISMSDKDRYGSHGSLWHLFRNGELLDLKGSTYYLVNHTTWDRWKLTKPSPSLEKRKLARSTHDPNPGILQKTWSFVRLTSGYFKECEP